MHPALAHAFHDHPVLARRDHPQLANAIRHALAAGEIVPLLPGTYGLDDGFHSRALSVLARRPDAVLTAGTAARLSWWPELTHEEVRAVAPLRSRRRVPGITLVRGRIDPDLVVHHGGLRLAHPAWSALELTDVLGGDAIDEALRRRATSLPAMRWALGVARGSTGNAARRRLLLESRDEPWSELEREAHVALRRARVTGWRANQRIVLAHGQICYPDILFAAERLVVELDGWLHHRSHESFVQDRARDVALLREGWVTMRFTAATMRDLVPAITDVRRILHNAARS